jgi:hypothetical protein
MYTAATFGNHCKSLPSFDPASSDLPPLGLAHQFFEDPDIGVFLTLKDVLHQRMQ